MKKGLISILIIVLILLMFVSMNGCKTTTPEEETTPELEYNYAIGSIAKNRVKNAQYLPNIEKLASFEEDPQASQNASSFYAASEENSEQASNMAAEYEPAFSGQDLEIDKEGFESILESLAVIDANASGKYGGYNIYEIKDEIYFVLEHVPAFNQWFRLPTMREEQGYSVTPYFESWAYYLEYDEKTQGVSITRVSWAFRAEYVDFETGNIIENYGDDETVSIFSIMKTNYYYDEDNKEVVECFLYNVLVDHSIIGSGKTKYYNPNPAHYHPRSFQYLKNVKDTSLTKYHINVARVYNSKEGTGLDITGRMPYGYTREFIQLDYTDIDNIQMLKVFQYFTPPLTYALDNQNSTDIYFYNKIGDTTQVYLSTHDYLNIPVIESHNLLETRRFILQSLADKVAPQLGFERRNVAGYFSFRPSVYSKVFDLEYKGSLRTSADYNSEVVSRCIRNFAGDDFDTVKFYLSKSLINMAKRLDVNKGWISSYEEENGNQLYLSNENFNYEQLTDHLLFAISKDVIDNSYLKNNWHSIFKGSDEAIELDEIKQISSVESGVILNEATSDISISNNKITYSLSAKIASNVLLEEGKEYSLSLVLKSKDNDYIILSSDYNTQYVKGQEYILTNTGEYALNSDLLVEQKSYELGYVFTIRSGEEDVVCSEFQIGKVNSFSDTDLEDRHFNGFLIRYEIFYGYNMMVIDVKLFDLEPPTIIFNGEGDNIYLSENAKIREIFKYFEIRDNDQIASIRVQHGDTYYDSFESTVQEGSNSLVVTDRTNTHKVYEFHVIITDNPK